VIPIQAGRVKTLLGLLYRYRKHFRPRILSEFGKENVNNNKLPTMFYTSSWLKELGISLFRPHLWLFPRHPLSSYIMLSAQPQRCKIVNVLSVLVFFLCVLEIVPSTFWNVFTFLLFTITQHYTSQSLLALPGNGSSASAFSGLRPHWRCFTADSTQLSTVWLQTQSLTDSTVLSHVVR
jgi:hypothetical protein